MSLRDRQRSTEKIATGLVDNVGREACGESANQVTYLQNTVKELQAKVKDLEGELLSLYRRLDSNF